MEKETATKSILSTMSLDHREYERVNIFDVAKDLEQMCKALDQKHRMQRKIQFFLDIRGYFIINQIKGNYLEFGVYRGEMMYCAYNVLGKIGMIQNYIGLDTFEGEPEPTIREQAVNPYVSPGDYASTFNETFEFLSHFMGKRLKLIKGDFRENTIISKAEDPTNRIALSVIDCNLLSSIEVSVAFSLPRMCPGGVIFVDDFFINMNQGFCEAQQIIEFHAKKNGVVLIPFNTYAPCARAFVVTKAKEV